MTLPRSVVHLALLVAAVTLTLAAPAWGQGGGVLQAEATGPVTPVMADHLADAVEEAEDGGYGALLIRLDTPGGLVTSMRDIVSTFLNARVPIVIYVAPSGAGAASAGYVITTAAHVAAMAPATNIGAATPVDQSGAEVSDKVTNDAVSYAQGIAEERGRSTEFAEEATRDGASITSTEAVDRDVIDLVADSQEQLLDEIDGRTVTLDNGMQATLQTADAEVTEYRASWTRRLLQRLADPNIAFLFTSLGTLAIIYELAQPGIGAGAIVGVILIVLSLFALSVLPVNTAGVALLVLAMALFVGEIFVPGIGVLAAGGTVSLLLAGLFLFQRPTGVGVDLAVLIPTVVVAGAGAAGLAVLAARTRSQPQASGPGGDYVGSTGRVKLADGTSLQVFVDGALWKARSPTANLSVGDEVRVTDREDLELIVEPVRDEEGTP